MAKKIIKRNVSLKIRLTTSNREIFEEKHRLEKHRPALVLCFRLKALAHITAEFVALICAAAGDIAAVILYNDQANFLSEDTAKIKDFVRRLQQSGISVLIDSSVQKFLPLCDINFEGMHYTQLEPCLTHLKNKGQQIIGLGNVSSKHEAMEAAEAGADYIFFGSLEENKQINICERSFILAAWWAGLMNIPCVVQGGNSLESVEQALKTGAEFVAIENVLFTAYDQKSCLDALAALLDAAEQQRK